MKGIRWIIFIVVFVTFCKSQKIVYSNETMGSCSYTATCTASGYTGVCVSISGGCCSSGTVTSNLCSGSSDIKCCTQSECTTPSGSGTCMQSSLCSSQGGTSVSGYCVGPSDLQCCVSATPSDDGQYGVDLASAITSTQATCLKNAGITYVIPRGFRSTGSVDTNVCNTIKTAAAAGIAGITYVIPRGFRSTGSVDTNVCNTIKTAAAAGIATRDTYIFPCPTCSTSASEQMGELITYLTTNCKSTWSGRIWLDIEGTSYWLSSSSANQAWYKVSE